MSIINIQNLTFCHETGSENLFNNINLMLDSSWKLGLVGRNGRGKTTFLELLLNKHPYFGKIEAKVHFDYFPFVVANPHLSVLNLINSIVEIEEWQAMCELSLLGFNEVILTREFATLSPGEQSKVLLAALFLKEENFLLLDEPTNHLDSASRAIIADYLASKSGFILVSHDRNLLDSCVDHILSINKTNIEIHKGNFSTYYTNKTYLDQVEINKNQQLNKQIDQLTLSSQRAEKWSNSLEATKYHTRNSGLRPDRGYIGHKSAKLMKRAKSFRARQEKAIEEKAKLLNNIETCFDLSLVPLTFFKSNLVTISNLDFAYQGAEILKDLNLTITQGEKIAIKGNNGSGKSTLLKLLIGELSPTSGRIAKSQELIIAYLGQGVDTLPGTLKELIARDSLDQGIFRSILAKLEVKLVSENLTDLSLGQKRKVLLAACISKRAHLYIFDEPLNYIDVLSCIQLEKLFKETDMSIVFVEHDEVFSANVATRSITLRRPER